MYHSYSFESHRLELHPCTDQWIRGDQWGTVTTVDFKNAVVRMRMDVSRKTLKVTLDHLMPRESLRQLFDACGKTLLIE